MKKYVIIALLAAILCGVCFYGFMDNLEKRNSPPDSDREKETKPEIKTVGVLSAAVNIPENTPVTADMIKLIEVTEESLPEEAVSDVESVLGLCPSREIKAGEMILTETFLPPDELNPRLSARIPDGMRAITVSVNEVTGLAGYIRPGDCVDVLQVMTTVDNDMVITTDAEMELELTTGCVTKTIAEGAAVLETGTPDYEEGEEEIYRSITLCLTPEKCGEVAAAEAMGSMIVVTLRAGGNTEPEYSQILSFSEM